MNPNILRPLPCALNSSPSSIILIGNLPFSPRRHRSTGASPTTCAAGEGGDGSGTLPEPEGLGLKFRRGSRRRLRRQQQQQMSNSEDGVKAPARRKEWEEMSMTEKAIELYVGEKGALFWLNKFAYASIFVVIGAWILFRFVGPALNLYQLDSPPLSPSSILKG